MDLVAGMQDIDISDDKTKGNQTLTHVHRHCYHSDLALSKHSPCNPYVYPSAMRRLEEVTKKYRAFLHSKNKDGFSYVRDPLLHPVWERHTDLK